MSIIIIVLKSIDSRRDLLDKKKLLFADYNIIPFDSKIKMLELEENKKCTSYQDDTALQKVCLFDFNVIIYMVLQRLLIFVYAFHKPCIQYFKIIYKREIDKQTL